MSLRKTFSADNAHEIPKANMLTAKKIGIINRIFSDIPLPVIRRKLIKITMPMR